VWGIFGVIGMGQQQGKTLEVISALIRVGMRQMTYSGSIIGEAKHQKGEDYVGVLRVS
jgi:hypothetical protein